MFGAGVPSVCSILLQYIYILPSGYRATWINALFELAFTSKLPLPKLLCLKKYSSEDCQGTNFVDSIN